MLRGIAYFLFAFGVVLMLLALVDLRPPIGRAEAERHKSRILVMTLSGVGLAISSAVAVYAIDHRRNNDQRKDESSGSESESEERFFK